MSYTILIKNNETESVSKIELDDINFSWNRTNPFIYGTSSMIPVGVASHYAHFSLSGTQKIKEEYFDVISDGDHLRSGNYD